jgi:lipopolysaccharide/colanic/teichoic acid biosynthesis glycosyltransferase
MSIVGPRPIVKDELEKYGNKKDKFLSVTPGLTGFWQASGRSDVEYDERIKMELYYVDNCSLWLDFKIILKTFVAVIKKEGAK